MYYMIRKKVLGQAAFLEEVWRYLLSTVEFKMLSVEERDTLMEFIKSRDIMHLTTSRVQSATLQAFCL